MPLDAGPRKTLGPVYTKCQHQRCDQSVITLASLFLVKTTESLENGLQPYSGVIPVFSMRTESLASSQSCRSGDADACYKQALTACDGAEPVLSKFPSNVAKSMTGLSLLRTFTANRSKWASRPIAPSNCPS